MKYKYLPMVITNLNLNNFGWTRKDHGIDRYSHLYARSDNKNYVLPDPKGNWLFDHIETAAWREFAKYRPKLLPGNNGLGQDKIYSEILRNIEKLKGQVK